LLEKGFTVSKLSAFARQAFASMTAIPTYQNPPSGRTYVFTNSLYCGSDSLSSVLETNDPKTIILQGNIYFSRYVVGSNTTILASGAQITAPDGAQFLRAHGESRGSYDGVHDIHIIGGTWTTDWDKTAIAFSHGRNICVDNATISNPYSGHALEFIACKDVWVRNCTLTGFGNATAHPTEERLQFDICYPKTAPNHITAYDGLPCENMYVTGCTIKGSRGVSVNFCSGEPNQLYHHNAVILNNKITGLASEALVVYNTVNVDIEDNVCRSMKKSKASSYSVGIHVHNLYNAPADLSGSTVFILNNTAYGGRQAINIGSHIKNKVRIGYADIENNKCYCRAGKKRAINGKKGSVKDYAQIGLQSLRE